MKNIIINSEPARLEFDQVSIAYHGAAATLQDVTFEIAHGDQVAVVGPNGAGKSTLFKALVGLLPLRSGSIRIHGMPLGHHQDCVAYIPRREEVDWRFPVRVQDVVMMGRYGKFGWWKRPSATDHAIVQHSLTQLGIADLARHPIGELSGGQQQRVFLARALAQEPHILLMDEPFNGIDATTQEVTLQLLNDLRQKQVTVLVSTHDLTLAAERFDKTLLLNHRIIAYGSQKEVFTAANIAAAFGGQVLHLDNDLVIDQCCPGKGDSHA